MHVFMGSSRIIVPNLGWNLGGNFIMAADLRGSISNDHFQSWEIFSALESPSFIPFPGKLSLKSMFTSLQRAAVKLFSCSTLINIANWEAMMLQNAVLQIYFTLPVSSFHRESIYAREFDIAYAMELINWNKKLTDVATETLDMVNRWFSTTVLVVPIFYQQPRAYPTISNDSLIHPRQSAERIRLGKDYAGGQGRYRSRDLRGSISCGWRDASTRRSRGTAARKRGARLVLQLRTGSSMSLRIVKRSHACRTRRRSDLRFDSRSTFSSVRASGSNRGSLKQVKGTPKEIQTERVSSSLLILVNFSLQETNI